MCFPYFEFVLFIVIEVLNRSSCLTLLETNFVKKGLLLLFLVFKIMMVFSLEKSNI